jgi:hypothetical protein
MAEDNVQRRLEQATVANVAADASNDFTEVPEGLLTSSGENGETELACSTCHRVTPVTQLTVVSKSRWNYDSALVVCPDCLTEMKLEVKQQSKGADVLMATVWAFIAFLISTTAICALIWFNRSETNQPIWGYIGAYLLLLPGFFIGKAVYFGSDRRHNRFLQLIAVGFTALTLLIANYVNQISAMNLVLDVAKQNGHALAYIDPPIYFTDRIIQPYFSLVGAEPLIALLVLVGTVIGLGVAYFASAGPNLYTRPFTKAQA